MDPSRERGDAQDGAPAPPDTANTWAMVAAALIVVAVLALAVRGVSEPALPLPEPIPTEAPAPEVPWTIAKRTDVGEGLAYAILEEGTGEPAAAGDVLVLDLQGWVEATGDRFLQAEGTRTVFGGGGLVEGVGSQLPPMRVGETRQIRVPPALGYGQTGKPPKVPRDAALVLELTLRSAEPPREVPTAPPDVAPDQDTDGVRWVRLAEGAGQPPAPGATVQVHVTTWLEDGTRIDSSLERMAPIPVRVGKGELYPGLDAAIATMLPGERRKLVVPPRLAAGERGRGPIPPNSTLIFDVERLAVE